ncbi:hypothetical protein [Streptomyces fumanus]|uniref:hypothetical protein n=1 Tax=Streptomyces fumanus TaxID=67302 RepID=UPI0033FE366A
MASESELAAQGIAGSADVLPVPVGPELEAAQQPAEGSSYPPALPWARLMDAEDLAEFLDELAASAVTYADRETALAEVEATCGRWRLIAEAQHGHNTAPGPDGEPAKEPGACTKCGDGPSRWCVGCAKCSCEPLHDQGCMYAAGGASCNADLGPGYTCQRPAGHGGDCEPTPDAEAGGAS